MAPSDSSDNERGRKHNKSKKKNRHRSRSDSSSSDRSRKHKRRYRSDDRKYKSNERRRSRSRDRRRSRSHDRNRSRTHSRSRERYKSQSRSCSRERKRSRSLSRERRRKNRDSHGGKSHESKSHAKSYLTSESDILHSRSHNSVSKKKDGRSITDDRYEDKLSLKEKVKILACEMEQEDLPLVPTSDQIATIENENFVQQNFSSTYIDPSNMPKQKKKKKKQKQKEELKSELEEELVKLADASVPLVSHEDAIFGNSMETMHVSRFSNRIDGKRKEELKNLEVDDIFGAIFFDKPEVRKKRWIEKLIAMRKSLLSK